ncbi:electron transfer flavoprotein subunit beta/FixA family protein [Halalkalirubrum salinum]|uniref:electron transfer flavoprotein subunit beta/FixA family protein n=1 Tax=Halalkalirubrum salinum TaxID=2563889 RepID=UPI0010FBAD04|nr:electron transfer flavoprotein subunit beta/FixA family protein [Halalkalirubrum salinum]
MNTLACIKRVPETGAKIVLTDDNQAIDTTSLGFTISPHEECGVEEAVQLAEETGGTATVLTLGSPEADEQLRTGIAMGADEAIHLETDGEQWGPRATASAIAEGIEAADESVDLLFFGNESADQENYQVGVRVAHMLGLPVVTGIKNVEIDGDTVVAEREISGGTEVFELPIPAVLTVKEGLNSPRYPSMRSKMQARRAEVATATPERSEANDVEMIELETPERDDSPAEVLGEGPEAAEDVVAVLEELEVI